MENRDIAPLDDNTKESHVSFVHVIIILYPKSCNIAIQMTFNGRVPTGFNFFWLYVSCLFLHPKMGSLGGGLRAPRNFKVKYALNTVVIGYVMDTHTQQTHISIYMVLFAHLTFGLCSYMSNQRLFVFL